MKKISVQEHFLLTENIIKTLTQNRITTIAEFLQEDIGKLSTITTLSLAEILDMRNDILLKYSAPLANSSTLLAKNLNARKFISTHIQCLDAALEGGIPVGCITELCGLAGSGKTQLCLQLAINCASSEYTVLYVDTKGDFSAKRIMKILDACGCKHEQMATIMSKIQVAHVWTLKDTVELLKLVKTRMIDNLGLLLIDSLPSLMMQHFGDDNKIGLTLLNELVNNVRFVSKELQVAVVCVNIQTRWLDHDVSDIDDDEDSNLAIHESIIERRNRCLGKYWKHIPSILLLVDKSKNYKYENKNSCRIQVQVCSYKSPNQIQRCTLKLDDVGVCAI